MAEIGYTNKEELIELTLQEITEGKSLRAACLMFDVPLTTMHGWLAETKELIEQYTCARDNRSDKIFEEVLTIADDSSHDTVTSDDGRASFNNEFAARSKIRIDARKWMLGKMQPKKYGDKLDVTSDGEKMEQNIIVLGSGVKPDNE